MTQGKLHSYCAFPRNGGGSSSRRIVQLCTYQKSIQNPNQGPREISRQSLSKRKALKLGGLTGRTGLSHSSLIINNNLSLAEVKDKPLRIMIPDSSSIPAEVKALVFDCDGTLVDTMPIHWRAWCKICKETGLVFHKTDFYTLAGVPGKKIINILAKQQGIKLDPFVIYDRKRKYFLEGLTSVAPIPCVVRIAREAQRLGIPIAVASGSSRTQVQKGINPTIRYFDYNTLKLSSESKDVSLRIPV